MDETNDVIVVSAQAASVNAEDGPAHTRIASGQPDAGPSMHSDVQEEEANLQDACLGEPMAVDQDDAPPEHPADEGRTPQIAGQEAAPATDHDMLASDDGADNAGPSHAGNQEEQRAAGSAAPAPIHQANNAGPSQMASKVQPPAANHLRVAPDDDADRPLPSGPENQAVIDLPSEDEDDRPNGPSDPDWSPSCQPRTANTGTAATCLNSPCIFCIIYCLWR